MHAGARPIGQRRPSCLALAEECSNVRCNVIAEYDSRDRHCDLELPRILCPRPAYHDDRSAPAQQQATEHPPHCVETTARWLGSE